MFLVSESLIVSAENKTVLIYKSALVLKPIVIAAEKVNAIYVIVNAGVFLGLTHLLPGGDVYFNLVLKCTTLAPETVIKTATPNILYCMYIDNNG